MAAAPPLRRGLSAALLALGLIAGPPAANGARGLPGRWVEATSENFVVLGNIPEKRATEIARQFEQIRSHYQRVLAIKPSAATGRLRIYVAGDEGALRLLMPLAPRARGRVQFAGAFVKTPAMNFIELRATTDREFDAQVVYHEYFHLVANQAELNLPLWLNEGLADFWASTRFASTGAEIGRPIPDRVRSLSSNWIPVERLVEIDQTSPEFRDRFRVGTLYAESWALTHYLILGDRSGGRAEQLREFMRLVKADRKHVLAAHEALGDLSILDRELREYVRKDRYPFGHVASPPPPALETIAIRELPDAEAAADVALALLHTSPTEYAAPLVALALDGAPGSIRTQAAAALLAVFEERWSDAVSGFERAALRPEADALIHYGAGMSRLMLARDPDTLARSETDLLRAIALDREYLPAYSRLADLYLQLDDDKHRALSMIRRALSLDPGSDYLRLREIQILALVGRRAESSALLEQLVSGALGEDQVESFNNLCWFGSLMGVADQVLPVCERAVAEAPDSAATLDSRGVARAISGDLAAAAADFRAAIKNSGSRWTERLVAQRRAWLELLDRGLNPFTEKEIRGLIDDPQESGGWGR